MVKVMNCYNAGWLPRTLESNAGCAVWNKFPKLIVLLPFNLLLLSRETFGTAYQ